MLDVETDDSPSLFSVVSSMAMTSFTDPGIIPRNLDPDPEMEWIEEAVEENEERLKQHGRIGGEQRAKARWIDIGKQSILTKCTLNASPLSFFLHLYIFICICHLASFHLDQVWVVPF